ncbi:MAG: amidohydrolase [Bryobacterales bacterium]|nr:amidohydrolase [Bryobacterales bacterium]
MRSLVSLLILGAAASRGEGLTAIVGATVVDGLGNPPFRATVLVRGEKIAAVGPEVRVPPGARVVQADGKTLLPGLFDLHTHLRAASVDWGKTLKAYLLVGVTSVVDFATYPEEFEPMRRLWAAGKIPGPRIALAARITTPGGHGAEAGRSEVFSLEVLTPREGRAAVKRVLPYQPDVIKVFTDGWRYDLAPDMTSMEEDTLTAIVEEAHKSGIEVLTHTVTLKRAKMAARAGVDVIAHGIGDAAADQELISLMSAKRTVYAPTLAVYEPRGASSSQPERRRRWENLTANVAALKAGGQTFGVGTDAGMPGTPHGASTLHELELLVRGGLTPVEAIAAATGNSARALGVFAERGSVSEGKLADLLLVDGAPHTAIEDIRRTNRVFLSGRELDLDSLRRGIADKQLTPIPAIQAAARIDDFERADGRSSIDTLWVNATDSGHDRTRMSFTRTLRGPGNRALSVIAHMAEKEKPFARLTVPLSRGGVEPVDASRFHGVSFDARGEGAYKLVAADYGYKESSAPFHADAGWKAVRIAFAALDAKTDALLSLSFEMARPPGTSGWLELDNLRFY